MSQEDSIARVAAPVTVASLMRDLGALGVMPGMTLMVHSSLSSLGYVSGGAQAVVTALLRQLGPSGTLMMPTHSTDVSDPAQWVNPPVPSTWWATLRREMPAFDPDLTPTLGMGAIVECFRHVRGVRRSCHPMVSAAAVGPNADRLINGHELDHGLGERSPQARLYDLDGYILLLGVGHDSNTSLHLAEHRAAPADVPMMINSAPVLVDGVRHWVSFQVLPDVDEDFERIGAAFAGTGLQRTSSVGAAAAHLMRARDLVDFAADWMRVNRTWSTQPPTHDRAEDRRRRDRHARPDTNGLITLVPNRSSEVAALGWHPSPHQLRRYVEPKRHRRRGAVMRVTPARIISRTAPARRCRAQKALVSSRNSISPGVLNQCNPSARSTTPTTTDWATCPTRLMAPRS